MSRERAGASSQRWAYHVFAALNENTVFCLISNTRMVCAYAPEGVPAQPQTTTSVIIFNGSPVLSCLVSLRTSLSAVSGVQKLNDWPKLDRGAWTTVTGGCRVACGAESHRWQAPAPVISSEEGTGPFFLQGGRKQSATQQWAARLSQST